MCTLIQCGFFCFVLSLLLVCLFVFNCLFGCFSMVVWTLAVLSVLYACVLYMRLDMKLDMAKFCSVILV